jgi:hypothetical protein
MPDQLSQPAPAPDGARVPLASPIPGAAPLHVHGSMAWYQGELLNQDIPASWMAQHYDFTEQGDNGGPFATAFLSYGGRYAVVYTDPEIIPFCYSPWSTTSGAKPGTCTGPIAPALNTTESAWLHDKSGNRLHVTAYGTQAQGHWQDRDNPAYGSTVTTGLPAAYHAWGLSTLTEGKWNAFEIDDFQSGYIPTYFTYKYGTTAAEFDKLGTGANAAWLAAQERIIAAAPKPVLLNGILSYLPSTVIALPNVLGVMVESCASTTNSSGITGSTWLANMNELLLVTSLHKYAVCVNYGTTLTATLAQRVYGLASWWLTFDPSYSVNFIDMLTADGHEVYPEHGIALYNPLKTATGNNIATLRSTTGVYLREFQYCYVNAVAIGACAAEVNSDTVTHSVPTTTYKYGHYLVLNTKSWYSGGTLTWAAGTFTTLPAASARILKI